MGYCPLSVNHEVSGRIITPIYDTYNGLIALSTRHLNQEIKNKFWHESFDKGSYLYGLCYAKDAIFKYNKAIIVEGEFDVSYFHSIGFNMTVGTCGSAFTLFQISLLSKFCSEFYLMFDGDEAGKAAIKRTMNDYKKYNLECYDLKFIPVFLPQNIDPDEFLMKEGVSGMKKKLKESREKINS